MRSFLLAYLLCLGGLTTIAQSWDTVSLTELGAFANPTKNWEIVGGVSLPPGQDELDRQRGTGVLLNQPTDRHHGNLRTAWEHGDMDLELDVMLPPGSNSGIYLQGRYEIQLFDSWGKERPGFSDMGGVYERYDEAAGRGWGGMAPAVNAARAPGLWQRLHIEFRAPEFDERGRKIADARLLRVTLNGTVIHENVGLPGPTRGAIGPETESGPLFIQGDHGAVAFRNIRYRRYDNPPLMWENLRYEAGQLTDNTDRDFPDDVELATGQTDWVDPSVTDVRERVALRFTGTLPILTGGTYAFTMGTVGFGSLTVAGRQLIHNHWGNKTATVELPPGEHEVRLTYLKIEPWFDNTLTLSVAGPGQAPQPLHDVKATLAGGSPNGPILIEATAAPRVVRSFIHVPDGKGGRRKVNTAAHVGYPSGIHYSYDMRGGNLLLTWRGDFLDASGMWAGRGNASVEPLADPILLDTLPAWSAAVYDPVAPYLTDAMVRPRGYELSEAGEPVFLYDLGEARVEDAITALPSGRGLRRTLTVTGTPPGDGYWRLATGRVVEAGRGRYLIDDAYWIEVPEEVRKEMVVRTEERDVQELTLAELPGSTVTYRIIY